ncbi:MAG: hypothetical protein OEZ22_10640 [Spirochaetia bacterium]|nr:hypothetical protein [Spirochaetia bacterium]
MKYYSKSPKEFHEEHSKKESSNKKRRMGHIILFLDIIIVIAIIFYFINTKKPDLNKNSINNISKSFQWKGYKIDSDCLILNQCSIKLNKDNVEEKISEILWVVYEKDISNVIFRKKEIITEEIEKLNTYQFNLELPFDLSENKKIQIYFLNSENKELLSFRVYP